MAGNQLAKKSQAKGSDVREGEVWAVPVKEMGFCPLVIAREPAGEVDFAFAYLRPVLSSRAMSARSIPPLEEWGHAWIGLVPTLPMRKGRWERCGELADFEREQWPVPPSRASAIDELRDPVEEWDQNPVGELWSIETMPDEPSMLVIDNAPASRDQALQFPSVEVVTAANSFEKALVDHFKGRSGSFWDMRLFLNDVRPEQVDLWRMHAAQARARWEGVPASWKPAGKKTDRELRSGQWLGFPARGGGFGAAMLICKPPRQFRMMADAIVMLIRRRWDDWPRIEELRSLKAEDGAMIAQTSMICVRDGRWRVIGEHQGFDSTQWPWPLPWSQDSEQRGTDRVSVRIPNQASREVRLPPDLLARTPNAGEVMWSSYAYRYLEQNVRTILDGTSNELKRDAGAIVTPDRLRAWSAINAEIVRATGVDPLRG